MNKALQAQTQATKMIKATGQTANIYRPGEPVQRINGNVAGIESLISIIYIDLDNLVQADLIEIGADAVCDVLHDSLVQESDVLDFNSVRYVVFDDRKNYLLDVVTHRSLKLKLEKGD